MGQYLDTPKIDKESFAGQSEEGSDLKLTYGACSMQGWRRTMEDALKIETKLSQGEALFGVFDGHGGKEVAEYCAREIVNTLQAQEKYVAKDYEGALRECFISLDAQLDTEEGLNKIVQISKLVQEEQRQSEHGDFAGGDASDETRRKIPQNVGTTACVVLVTPTEIYCANAGDSRAILGRGTSVYDLSDDHKPDNEDELIRIEAAGAHVSDGRVQGKLSLSRAIGDMAYKQNTLLNVEQQAITCVPDVTRRARHPDDSFVLIACDGIWDVLSSRECTTYLRDVIDEHKGNDEPAYRLVEGLFDDIIAEDIHDQNDAGDGTDNMSAILIQFPGGAASAQQN